MDPAHRFVARSLDGVIAILSDISDHPQAIATSELALTYAREIARWTESTPSRNEAVHMLERVLALKEQVHQLLHQSTRSRRR